MIINRYLTCAALAVSCGWLVLGQVTGGLATGHLSSALLYPRDGNVSVYPGQHVFVRPSASEYVVTYLPDGLEANRVTIRVPTHGFARGSVSVTVSKDSGGKFHYVYSVRNDPHAEAAIESIALILAKQDASIVVSHPRWQTSLSEEAFDAINVAQFARWSGASASDRIQPGSELTGLAISSSLAPGYVMVSLRGHSETPEPTSDMLSTLPSEVKNELARCRAAQWDSQMLRVIGPRFTAAASASEVAENFRFGFSEQSRKQKTPSPDYQVIDTILKSAVKGGANTHASEFDLLRQSVTGQAKDALSALQLTLANLQGN